MIINFASDNAACVHPEILKQIVRVNSGAVSSYGNDPYTEEAKAYFKKHFGENADIHFVFTGTAANTISLAAMTRPFNMILTSPASHITEDECGSVQHFTGCPVRFVRSTPGKLTPADLEPFLPLQGDVHKSQPKAVSISQATEMGEVYTEQELAALSGFCKKHGMYLHIDGARFANAVNHLGAKPTDIAKYADILCFGGTKNGAMGAEALVVNNLKLSEDIKYILKQGMQLASKMRYISAQFIGMFEEDVWMKNAENANKMSKKLYDGIKNLPNIKILYPLQVNMMFIEMKNEMIKELLKIFYFYILTEGKTHSTVRLMTSWQTTGEEVEMLIDAMKKHI